MKVTLAEFSLTLPGGAILKLVRYHEATQKRSGPPHMELLALRGEKKARLEVEPVSNGSMQQLLELYRRRIDAIVSKGVPTAGILGTVEEFVAQMAELEMFLPAVLEASK